MKIGLFLKFILALALLLALGHAEAATPTFTVSGGKIIGPNGQQFVPMGVDVIDCGTNNTSCLLSLTAADIVIAFPGINFVKVQVEGPYPPPSNYTAWVNALTSQGIVVQFTDYNGFESGASYGTGWVALTSAALTAEVNWYAAMATAFIGNPYVWFNTQNEIFDGPTAGASQAEQVAVYNAIRGTGSNAIIGIELLGGTSTGVSYYGFLNAASFTSRTNVIWDAHFYNCSVAACSTSLATNEADLAAEISAAQTFANSANGVIPAIIGEYGNSTGGTLPADAGWSEAVAAVLNAATNGYGSGADVYYYPYAQGGPGATGDQMFNGQPSATVNPPTLANSGLSAYGAQVAAGIKAASATTCVSSPNGTVILNGAGGTILDATCDKWTVTGGVVFENGALAGFSANVTKIAIVGSEIWQLNTTGQWWGSLPVLWTGPAATSPLPVTGITAAQQATVTAVTNDLTKLQADFAAMKTAIGAQ